MLYYLGSHRWLWGRGWWGSQHASALPLVSLRSFIMPFTPARPLAIAIHPPASLTTGLWWYGSSRYWVARP